MCRYPAGSSFRNLAVARRLAILPDLFPDRVVLGIVHVAPIGHSLDRRESLLKRDDTLDLHGNILPVSHPRVFLKFDRPPADDAFDGFRHLPILPARPRNLHHHPTPQALAPATDVRPLRTPGSA